MTLKLEWLLDAVDLTLHTCPWGCTWAFCSLACLEMDWNLISGVLSMALMCRSQQKFQNSLFLCFWCLNLVWWTCWPHEPLVRWCFLVNWAVAHSIWSNIDHAVDQSNITNHDGVDGWNWSRPTVSLMLAWQGLQGCLSAALEHCKQQMLQWECLAI